MQSKDNRLTALPDRLPIFRFSSRSAGQCFAQRGVATGLNLLNGIVIKPANVQSYLALMVSSGPLLVV
jgi:hypothetical protein